MFAVRFRPNPKRDGYRAAVVVSKKVSKSAVARNRIRRRLYEAIRLLDADISEPYDIVVNVFNDHVLEEPHLLLKGQLKRQFKQAGIIRRRGADAGSERTP